MTESTNPVDPAKALNDAMQYVEQQFANAKPCLDQIKKDEEDIAWDDQHVASTDTPTQVHQTINAAQQDVKTQEQKLAQYGFTALQNTLESLNTSVVTLRQHNTDVQKTLTIIDAFFKAMESELRRAIIDQAMDLNSWSNEDLASLAQADIQSQVDEAKTVKDEIQDIQNMRQPCLDAKDGAMMDMANHANLGSMLISLMTDGDIGNQGKDSLSMADADANIGAQGDLIDLFSDLSAQLCPDMTQVLLTIKDIIKEIKEVMNNSSLSVQEKRKQVLGLVMFLLSILQILKQELDNNKTNNDSNIASATQDSSKQNVAESGTQTKIKTKVDDAQDSNTKVQIALEVVMGVAMILMTGGIGSALLIAGSTTYEALNTSGKIHCNQDLGDKMGSQIGGDIVVGAGEGVATFGVGMALDKFAEKAASYAVKYGTELAVKGAESEITAEATRIATQEGQRAAAKVLASGAEDGELETAEASARAYDQAYDRAYTAARTTLQDLAQNVAEKTAKRTAQQFLKQKVGAMVELAVKKEFKKELLSAVEKTTKEAVEKTLEEGSTYAKLAARGAGSSETVLNDLTTRNANEVVSSFTNRSTSSVQKDSVHMGWGPKQLIALVNASLMNNNLMVDSAKKAGASDDAWYTMLLGAIQALLQMVMLMYGSGALRSADIDGIISKIPRYANLISTVPEAIQVGNSVSMGQTSLAEADAVTKLAELEATADVYNTYLDMLQQHIAQGRNTMVATQQSDGSDINSLVVHLNEGDQAGINVMLSASA